MSTQKDNLNDVIMQIGFVERTVEQLSEVVLEQANTIERLERRIKELDDRMAQKQEGGLPDGPDPLDEKPPHY
ncbi:MAG: putative coiled-coil protein SlyX [Candidatus Paceibacteria bacterium]|jgi:uncharacterized coiled-coil protein SlyX